MALLITLIGNCQETSVFFNLFITQERALYLSLKYEFVTPLTSLVVVKPDSKEKGNFGDADESSSDSFKKINFMNSANQVTSSIWTYVSLVVLLLPPLN